MRNNEPATQIMGVRGSEYAKTSALDTDGAVSTRMSLGGMARSSAAGSAARALDERVRMTREATGTRAPRMPRASLSAAIPTISVFGSSPK